MKIRTINFSRNIVLIFAVIIWQSSLGTNAILLEGDNLGQNVNPEKPDVPINKNDAFQKVQKRRVQEKR